MLLIAQRALLMFYRNVQAPGGFPGGSLLKNPARNSGDARDMGSTPGSGRSPGGGHGNHSSILAWEILWHSTLAGYSP